jgi:SAM-dependent methyltransferase
VSFEKLTQITFNKINQGPSKMPRRLKLARKIKIVKPKVFKKWLDLGAGDGTYLKFMSPGSIGLDIKSNAEKRIKSWNFNDPIPSDLENNFDVIWCSNLIEHVLSPHEFMIKIKKFLKPDGILIIACPQTLIKNPFIYKGTLQGDHVNFYNLSTLKLSVKYSGYQILFAGTPSFTKLGSKFAFIAPTIMVVARPIMNFQYPASAHKVLDGNGNIIFKEENFGH